MKYFSKTNFNLPKAIGLTLTLAGLFTLVMSYISLDINNYIIKNTAHSMSLGINEIETQNAAVALFNNASPIAVPFGTTLTLSIIGGILLLLGGSIFISGKKALTKKYWTSFERITKK